MERPAISTEDCSFRKYVSVLGVPMAYVDVGHGDPIVFLHGNPTPSYLWRNIVPYMVPLGRCLAPDFVGMGNSGTAPDGGYRFVDHQRYLDAWFEAMGLDRNVILVVHDWGSALGFAWARRHPDKIKALVYMEAIVRPFYSWDEWPEATQAFFKGQRTPAGEDLILEKNLFVEYLLPLRGLSEDVMDVYRRYFRTPGPSRRPMLEWTRDLPIAGEPEDVVRVVDDYSRWLAASRIPKLFINGDPGGFLIGAQREFCRTWPNQQEVTIEGTHFLQEDSPAEIGQATARFIAGVLAGERSPADVYKTASRARSATGAAISEHGMSDFSTELHYLTIVELAARIAARQISPVEVTRAQLDRIAALDGALDSYALVTPDLAMAAAKAAEAEIGAGRYRGPLHGVPLGVKDLFWTEGVPTAAGMAIHKDFRPAEDATAVRCLRAAGAILLGKLQTTEGAYSDYHPSVVAPKNPWNPAYWPGISSSGPGVATAAGLCYGALASDTGGSIRWPAAASGTTGLKPTWGRVSRYGVFELAATLDHVGPIARSAADAGVMLAAIAGSDPLDPTALPDPVPDTMAAAGQGVRGLRIGIDAEWNSDDVDVATQAVLAEAVEAFRALGATIVDVQFPDVTQTIADWVPNCAVEAAVAHEATYPARKDDYGPILASVIEAGRAVSGIDYQKILLRRLDLRGRVAALFGAIDLLLIPAHPFAPLTLAMMGTLGEQPDLIAKLQRYTCPFDMTGNPTITLPGGFTDAGLPIAFQLVAGALGEATLVRAGAAFQGVTSWHRRHPLA